MSCAGGGGKAAARFQAKLRQALDVSRPSHNHASPSSHFDPLPSPSTTTAHRYRRQFASSPRRGPSRYHLIASTAIRRGTSSSDYPPPLNHTTALSTTHWATSSSRHERCCAYRNRHHRVATSPALHHAVSKTATSGLAAGNPLAVLLPQPQCALRTPYHPRSTTSFTSR